MPTPVAELSPEALVARSMQSKLAALQGKLAESEKWAKRLLSEQEAAEARFNALAAIKEEVERDPILIPQRHAVHQDVVLVNWSDWHVGEIVDKSKVQGKNHYNPKEAAKRARQCAVSTLKLWKYINRSYKVDTMVLFLGGDFITGYLHEELAQTNAMPPVEETRFAKQLLMDALSLIAGEKTIKKLRIVGMRGNHGRTTKKMQYKNDYGTSYESWLYWDLQGHFADKRIEFDVPKGDVHITQVLPGWRLRLYHGHQFRYADGVGGITIPLNKWQSKQQQISPAEFNLHGHYHTYCAPNPYTIQNGSTKGFDEYAASHGFPYQEPLQTFAVLDARRRIIAQHLPIFCT